MCTQNKNVYLFTIYLFKIVMYRDIYSFALCDLKRTHSGSNLQLLPWNLLYIHHLRRRSLCMCAQFQLRVCIYGRAIRSVLSVSWRAACAKLKKKHNSIPQRRGARYRNNQIKKSSLRSPAILAVRPCHSLARLIIALAWSARRPCNWV